MNQGNILGANLNDRDNVRVSIQSKRERECQYLKDDLKKNFITVNFLNNCVTFSQFISEIEDLMKGACMADN